MIERLLEIALISEGLAQAVERPGLVPAIAVLPRETEGDVVLVDRLLCLRERQEVGAQLVSGDRLPAVVPDAGKGVGRLAIQAGCQRKLALVKVLPAEPFESFGLKSDVAEILPNRERLGPAPHSLLRLDILSLSPCKETVSLSRA